MFVASRLTEALLSKVVASDKTRAASSASFVAASANSFTLLAALSVAFFACARSSLSASLQVGVGLVVRAVAYAIPRLMPSCVPKLNCALMLLLKVISSWQVVGWLYL